MVGHGLQEGEQVRRPQGRASVARGGFGRASQIVRVVTCPLARLVRGRARAARAEVTHDA